MKKHLHNEEVEKEFQVEDVGVGFSFYMMVLQLLKTSIIMIPVFALSGNVHIRRMERIGNFSLSILFFPGTGYLAK